MGVAVGVAVGVGVGVAIKVGVAVGVAVGVLVGVAVSVGVAVGDGATCWAGVGMDAGAQADKIRLASKSAINARFIVRLLLRRLCRLTRCA